MLKEMFKNKSILITGGTGVSEKLLKNSVQKHKNFKRLVV